MATTTIDKVRASARTRAANLKAEIDKWRGKTTELRKQVRESKKPQAAIGAACAVTAGAATGGLKGLAGDDEWMGVPIDAAGGLVLLAGGAMAPGDLGAALISASGGPFACYANAKTEEAVSNWWDGE